MAFDWRQVLFMSFDMRGLPCLFADTAVRLFWKPLCNMRSKSH